MLAILYWILLLLCLIGAFVPDTPGNPWPTRGRWVIVLILFAILGFKVLRVAL